MRGVGLMPHQRPRSIVSQQHRFPSPGLISRCSNAPRTGGRCRAQACKRPDPFVAVSVGHLASTGPIANTQGRTKLATEETIASVTAAYASPFISAQNRVRIDDGGVRDRSERGLRRDFDRPG